MPRQFRALPALLFALLIGLPAATGCGIVGDDAAPTTTPTLTASATVPTSTRVPTRTPVPSETPVPTETPQPPPPATEIPAAPPQSVAPSDGSLARGRTALLRVAGEGAASATVTYRGDLLGMLSDGVGGFWRPVGASATAALGDFPAVYTLYDALGGVIGTRNSTLPVVFTEYPVEYITLPPGQIESITPDAVQTEINIRASTFAGFAPEKLWDGPFIFPVAGAISAPYGVGRSYNGAPVSNFHSGTDFGAEEGTPIGAAARGRVAFAGFLATRGNSVIVDHGAGVFTGYHHMSRIDAVQGAEIAQGGAIGAVGATGLATGPHLHWELIVAGVNVDPVFWTYQGVAP